MGFDIFTVGIQTLFGAVYGSICLLSLIFTFSLDTYLRIEEKLGYEIFSTPLLTSLEADIDWLDIWLKERHRAVGGILMVLSFCDVLLAFTLDKIIYLI
jgi:hypothetical protein